LTQDENQNEQEDEGLKCENFGQVVQLINIPLTNCQDIQNVTDNETQVKLKQ